MDYDVEKLVSRISLDIGDTHDCWFTPRGYPGLASALLDPVYSTGNHYTGVKRLVARYSDLRLAQGGSPAVDTAHDLITFIDHCGGATSFAEQTGNRWRAWARRNAPLKADVTLGAAMILHSHGLETVETMRVAFSDRSAREESPVAKEWHKLPGQRSGLTWNYVLMLCGLPGVKADRMIRRYVTNALDMPKLIGAQDASRLLEQAGDQLDVHYTKLDHTIWRFESKREHLKDSGLDAG